MSSQNATYIMVLNPAYSAATSALLVMQVLLGTVPVS